MTNILGRRFFSRPRGEQVLVGRNSPTCSTGQGLVFDYCLEMEAHGGYHASALRPQGIAEKDSTLVVQ